MFPGHLLAREFSSQGIGPEEAADHLRNNIIISLGDDVKEEAGEEPEKTD